MSIPDKSRGQLGIAALAAIGMAFSLPAAAQTDEEAGEAAEDDPMVEEIVVTATYRDTDLMDTPLTISALTDVEIEQRGIEDISHLYLVIPGLNYGMATQTYHSVSARGIDNLSFGMSPSVSTYVDNMPISGFNEYRQPLAPIFDLERIEVLKGPQGTLYGEGSMAGAIRYITKGPSPEGFDYAVTARAYKHAVFRRPRAPHRRHGQHPARRAGGGTDHRLLALQGGHHGPGVRIGDQRGRQFRR